MSAASSTLQKNGKVQDVDSDSGNVSSTVVNKDEMFFKKEIDGWSYCVLRAVLVVVSINY